MPHKKQYICSVCKNPFYRRASTVHPLLLSKCNSCNGTTRLKAKQTSFPLCPICNAPIYIPGGKYCGCGCSVPVFIASRINLERRVRICGYMKEGLRIIEIATLEGITRQYASQLVIKTEVENPELKAFWDKIQVDKCAAKYLWCVDCHDKKTSKFVWNRVHPEGKEYRCKECRLETLYIEVPCDACGHIFKRRRKEFFYTQHTGKKKKSFYCCNLCKSDGMKGIPISQRGDINLRDETSQ